MDILDNTVNKRIMSGNFPVESLYPSTIEGGREIDIDARAESMMKQFEELPELFTILFIWFSKKVDELELLNRPEVYLQSVNYYINARCSEDYLKVNGSLQEAFKLAPVVTPLDKTLWFGAYAYQLENEIDSVREYDPVSMMFAWIKILNLAQNMELESHRTIDVKKVKSSTNILDLIKNGFSGPYVINCTRKLSNAEYNGLKTLTERRKALLSEIQDEKRLAEEVAAKTQTEWDLFLRIVNDFSEKEAIVVQRINEAASAKDKLRAIYYYDYIVTRIKKGKYDLGGEEVDLLSVFDGVQDRMQDASTYASARIGEGDPFRLHPALFVLAMEPYTYNYLFMIFHQFRLAPNKDNAKKFVSLALSYIKKNLGGEDRKYVSLDEMISDFYTTASDFMRDNKTAIDRLSFDKLQPDSVAVIGTSLEDLRSSDTYYESMVAKVKAYKESGTFDADMEQIVEGNIKTVGLNEALKQLEEAEQEYDQNEKEAVARKLVLSLNIIYMFCDALRIMLSNKRSNIKIKKIAAAQQYRKELLILDDKLVHKVYAHLDEQEMGMLEYREKAGILTSTLSEQEAQEEQYRNSVFSDVLKDAIEQLATGIENQDSEQILQTKAKIRMEILRFPDCDDKSLYANWLDSISDRISAALISNCRKQADNYSEIKKGIQTALGALSQKLPLSTLDSLTTAEMLYGRYATDDFANKGFDFSCISALYYQAFEDAYNDLIWRGYATLLNSLVINGQKYTDILEANRRSRITDPDAKGYLDDANAKQRGYYINYRNRMNPVTTVSLRCMYKSFAILMENIHDPSDLDKFCDYYAKLAGYPDRNDMFRDTTFMTKCQEFTNAISNSADNRNNASHGGSFISIGQCTDDKKTVLNDLETVRLSSIGLIQQLLYLLQNG